MLTNVFIHLHTAQYCEELTHLKRPWCWERLRVRGEEGDRGWDDWMASPTQWTWVCVNSGSWWWTGRPGVLQSMGLQRVEHDWVTELKCYYQNAFPGSSGSMLKHEVAACIFYPQSGENSSCRVTGAEQSHLSMWIQKVGIDRMVPQIFTVLFSNECLHLAVFTETAHGNSP